MFGVRMTSAAENIPLYVWWPHLRSQEVVPNCRRDPGAKGCTMNDCRRAYSAQQAPRARPTPMQHNVPPVEPI